MYKTMSCKHTTSVTGDILEPQSMLAMHRSVRMGVGMRVMPVYVQRLRALRMLSLRARTEAMKLSWNATEETSACLPLAPRRTSWCGRALRRRCWGGGTLWRP